MKTYTCGTCIYYGADSPFEEAQGRADCYANPPTVFVGDYGYIEHRPAVFRCDQACRFYELHHDRFYAEEKEVGA